MKEATISEWLASTNFTQSDRRVLCEYLHLVEPEMESILDRIYQHILGLPNLKLLFRGEEALERAKVAQKRHWEQFVLCGTFDGDYYQVASRIGYTHYHMGVPLHSYIGTYEVAKGAIVDVIRQKPLEETIANNYCKAISKAIQIDLGVSTSVYFNTAINKLEETAHQITISLARVSEYRDRETGNHIMRMSEMCRELALAAQPNKDWANMIWITSPLHDLGKVGIPDDILLKVGDLSEEEWEVMRNHPNIGGEIIPELGPGSPAQKVILMARNISLTHHERWDGSGYPLGLKGEEIPVEGRIVAICDVYDALLSARSYKEPWPKEKAQAYILENKGKLFDPGLVDSFISVIDRIDRVYDKFIEK